MGRDAKLDLFPQHSRSLQDTSLNLKVQPELRRGDLVADDCRGMCVWRVARTRP